MHELVAFDREQQQLAGFNVSADGAQVLYGLSELYSGEATLYSVPATGGEPRRLFDVAGAESGNGGVEGFGAIGFVGNGQRILFEDEAQVFTAAPDGADRRPVNDQALYGASSWHWYVSSPDGTYVYKVGSGAPNFLTLFKTTEAYSTYVTLDPADVPVALLDEGQTLLATTLDPSLDQIEGNPATRDRTLVGYALYNIGTLQRTALQFGGHEAAPPLPAIVSDAAGDFVILQGAHGQLALAHVRNGTTTPVELAGHLPDTHIVLRVPR